MSKVFIIEHTSKEGIDVSTASSFGDIVYLFSRSERHASAFKHAEFGWAIIKRLKELNFDPNRDYVCCTGSVIALVVAFIALAKVYPVLRILMFNSVDGVYVERRFDDTLFSGDVIGVANDCIR